MLLIPAHTMRVRCVSVYGCVCGRMCVVVFVFVCVGGGLCVVVYVCVGERDSV